MKWNCSVLVKDETEIKRTTKRSKTQTLSLPLWSERGFPFVRDQMGGILISWVAQKRKAGIFLIPLTYQRGKGNLLKILSILKR
jgi:hypothetical protein